MPAQRTRGRKILSVLLAILSVAVVEVAVRVYFATQVGPRVLLYGTPWHRREKQAPFPMRPDSVQRHGNDLGTYTKYFPNEVKTTPSPDGKQTYSVRINSRGFRGREFTVEKAPGVIRVITLGASSTLGYSNRDDETYPYYLEHLLNSQGRGTKRFEVINLAIPHLTSTNIVALFLAEGVQLDPDFVTLYSGVNDSGFAVLEGAYAGFWWGARQRLLMLAFFHHLALPWIQPAADTWSESIAASCSKVFLRNVAILRDECRRRNIHLIVASQQVKSTMVPPERIRGVTYADEVRLVEDALARGGEGTRLVNPLPLAKAEAGDPEAAHELQSRWNAHIGRVLLVHSRLMRDLEEWATANGVDFVDIIEELDQERDLLLSWVHLHPDANRKVASAFARKILERAGMAGGN